MAAQVANIDFARSGVDTLVIESIQYDLVDLANRLRRFVVQGSKRHSLSKSDLTVVRSNEDQEPNPITFTWLIEHGTRFFDALFFLSLAEADRPPIQVAPVGHIPAPVTVAQICQALFYILFFGMSRGIPSEAAGANIGRDVPNFLSQVLGMNEPPVTYARRLASFHLNKIDPAWMKYIPIGDLGREAISRFGLGVAGYRYLAPFKLLPCRGDVPANIRRAYDVARGMALSPPSWQIHPATRDPQILAVYGPLNGNLCNLMLECFTADQLATLVATKAIFELPQHQPAHVNYRTWTDMFQPNLQENIF